MASFTQHPHYAPVTICHVDGGMAWCIQKDNVIYMANVWVHPDKREQGVGKSMMAKIRKHFAPIPIHTDYVPDSKPFWEKMMAEGIIENIIHEEIDFEWIKG